MCEKWRRICLSKDLIYLLYVLKSVGLPRNFESNFTSSSNYLAVILSVDKCVTWTTNLYLALIKRKIIVAKYEKWHIMFV